MTRSFLGRHRYTKSNLALSKVPIESSHAHVDRPHFGVLDDALALELLGEPSEGHPLGGFDDDFLHLARRAVGVGIDHEQPPERAQQAEHRE